ncbi:MAG: hypothetical protein R2861_07085 [Desulfobacterales bacterium]
MPSLLPLPEKQYCAFKRKSHVMMATALTHGIITDTNGFVYAHEEDFRQPILSVPGHGSVGQI